MTSNWGRPLKLQLTRHESNHVSCQLQPLSAPVPEQLAQRPRQRRLLSRLPCGHVNTEALSHKRNSYTQSPRRVQRDRIKCIALS